MEEFLGRAVGVLFCGSALLACWIKIFEGPPSPTKFVEPETGKDVVAETPAKEHGRTEPWRPLSVARSAFSRSMSIFGVTVRWMEWVCLYSAFAAGMTLMLAHTLSSESPTAWLQCPYMDRYIRRYMSCHLVRLAQLQGVLAFVLLLGLLPAALVKGIANGTRAMRAKLRAMAGRNR